MSDQIDDNNIDIPNQCQTKSDLNIHKICHTYNEFWCDSKNIMYCTFYSNKSNRTHYIPHNNKHITIYYKFYTNKVLPCIVNVFVLIAFIKGHHILQIL